MGWRSKLNPVSYVKGAVSTAREVTGGAASAVQGAASGLAGAIQSAASAAGSVVSKAASAARGITGAVYDQIGSLAQKIGNTVEAIASNPKALAAVAISIAFPAAAPALGEYILGAELAASIGAAGTAAVGNMCLNTAMNGGDVGQAVKTTALQYAGNIGSQKLTEIVKNADIVPDAFAKNVGTTTTYAAIQAAQGKDPTIALLTGGANACAQLLVQEVPGFSEMPKATQDAITKATAGVIQGKPGVAINEAINFATNFAKDEYKAYKEANDNGFGYDATSWKDAKQIGITNPQDYQYAKTIGADNPYDLQIGKSVGAKDNLDLSLAKDVGVNTADDLNYAKQIGVNNKDDFTLAKEVGAQNSTDFNLAKIIGLDNAKDLTYAKTVGVNNTDDFNLAKNIGAQKFDDVDFAKLLGIDTSKDFNYAKTVGAGTADDFGLAKQVDAHDATDLNVAKQYGISDKDTLSQYSDFLGRGTEKASTSTIKGADGTELTIDNEGNLVKYTYDTGDGRQDITDEVENVARRAGGYTLRGDDGSTITINEDGTVSATDAPDDAYLRAGTKKSPISYAKLTGAAAQNRATTQQTDQGGVNQATIRATQLSKAGARELTPEDLMGLLQFMGGGGGEQYYYPTEGGQGSEDQLAKVEVGGPSAADINYLANLGGKSSYLGSLDQGAPSEGGQPGQGKDIRSLTEGPTPPPGQEKNIGGGGAPGSKYVSSGPVGGGGGGGGYSMDSIVKMLQSQGGASPYGAQRDTETARLIQSLQNAGLEDQSAAETQRLASAQGPVAIGQVPTRTQQVGVPAAPATPAAPAAATTLGQTEQATAKPSSDELLKQLQSYASSAAGQASSLFGSMFAPKTWTPVPGTPFYRDQSGNIGQKVTYVDSSGKTVTTIK